jgi:hypothetical protein
MKTPVKIGYPHRMGGTLLGQLGDASVIRERIVRVFPGHRIIEVEQRLGDGAKTAG